uniref:Uncharacterized protein n=1 Tax=Daucus carota subsp. sativus TaxID=79200 RepID=A0A162A0B6_DAUCS
MQPVRKVARKRSSSSLMSQPTALSPSKKQRVEALETTVASSLPSQQGSDFEMADKQSLDPFSLQDVAIEIDRPAAVTCTESSTALALTLVPAQTDTQAELGSVQVNLPSQASGGRFVPPLPLNPSQGTLVVYTGTAGRVNSMSEERQTPSDTHAREASETALSVREVSAHTNTAQFEEQMAKLRAELERMIAENERLKGAQLVTLEQKAEERPSSSYMDELKEEIHELAVEMRSNHELYMSKFETINSKLDQLLRNSNKSDDQPSGEDPSTKGENRDKGDRDDRGNSSNQSNKDNTTSGSAPDKETHKSKGKEPLHQSDNVFNSDSYDDYPQDMDDDDVFDATYRQAEEEGKFDESYLFQDEEPVDLEHEENVWKFKAENEARKRKLRDYQKLLEDKLITEEQIKIEKQKIYDAAIKQKNLDIRRKEGKSWDIARRIFNGPQREPFDDNKFLSLIYDLREVNPDEDVFMHAFALELNYVTVGVNNLLEQWELIVYTQRNGSFRLSVESLKSFSVSELWVLRNKVRRSSNLNELLRDKLLEQAVFNSPQVVRNPYCVKFVHKEIFSTVYLNEEALPKYPAKQLALASTLLRTKGFASKAKSDADDVILAYCTRKNVAQYFRRMKNVTKSQPSDFREDPVDLEVLHQLALAKERKKRGESTTSEVPTREEPSTPILHTSDIEEGEVDL